MKQLNALNPNTLGYSFESIVGESLSKEEERLFNFNRLVANCITKRRKELGMTQEDLAKASGVSRITISAIEKRKRVVSTEVLLKLLDALDLDIVFV